MIRHLVDAGSVLYYHESMKVHLPDLSDLVLRALNGVDHQGSPGFHRQDACRSQFRKYVEEWIDTGREGLADQQEKDHWERTLGISRQRFAFGTEVIAQRNLNHAPAALKAATDYIRAHRPAMLPPTNSGMIPLVFGWAEGKSPAEEAARLFCLVLFSWQQGEWGARLAKCRYAPCGCYFLMARLGRTYRNGTFCTREHNKLASAAACTRRLRQQQDAAMIEFAAQQLHRIGAKGPQWCRDRSLKEKLVMQLSRDLSKRAKQQHRAAVTLNWVTRNCERIEAARSLQRS